MTRQVIDTTTDHGNYRGDPGKTAWDKANLNFAELYLLFQTAANKLGYFDSNGKPAFTDITDFARSLLDDGDAAAARATLGLGTAAVAALVGSVSSGAVIEIGSNSNGNYVRYAGGKQDCWQAIGPVGLSANGGTYRFDWTFPATFVGAPVVSPCYSGDFPYRIDYGCEASITGSLARINFQSRHTDTLYGYLMAYAAGRWK